MTNKAIAYTLWGMLALAVVGAALEPENAALADVFYSIGGVVLLVAVPFAGYRLYKLDESGKQ